MRELRRNRFWELLRTDFDHRSAIPITGQMAASDNPSPRVTAVPQTALTTQQREGTGLVRQPPVASSPGRIRGLAVRGGDTSAIGPGGVVARRPIGRRGLGVCGERERLRAGVLSLGR